MASTSLRARKNHDLATMLMRGAATWLVLLVGCDNISDSIKKNWSGHGDAVEANQSAGLVAGSAAPAGPRDSFSYSFLATQNHSDPSTCGNHPFGLQLDLKNDLSSVDAVVGGQPWPCGGLDYDGAAYYVVCRSRTPGAVQAATGDASVMVGLYARPTPDTRVDGEAILTLSTPSGTCEHSYALTGDLVR